MTSEEIFSQIEAEKERGNESLREAWCMAYLAQTEEGRNAWISKALELRKSMTRKVNLEEWYGMTFEERGDLMKKGMEFDETSRMFLAWAEAFNIHGACISNQTILSAYRHHIEANKA